MILILSDNRDLHVQRVVTHLHPKSYQLLDLRDLGEKIFIDFDPVACNLIASSIEVKKMFHWSEITSVWYRRPQYKRGSKNIEEWKRVFSENEERSPLDGSWRCLKDSVLWLNNPFANRDASNKLYQLSVARRVGFEVPETVVTNNPITLRQFANQKNSVVYKPLHISHIDRPGRTPLVFLTRIFEKNNIEELAHRVCVTPCLFQEYIAKEYEIRVTVLGNQVFSTALYSQEFDETRHDWRRNPVQVRHVATKLPADVEQKCLALVQELKLTFGAIDLIFSMDGKFVFLEINPNGQWLWIEDMTGHPISHSIAAFLQGDSYVESL